MRIPEHYYRSQMSVNLIGERGKQWVSMYIFWLLEIVYLILEARNKLN